MVWSQSTFPDDLTLPNIDPSMQAIAQYLMDGLNERINRILDNVIAVRAFDCYNSLPGDLSRFPLLKVYRTTDTFKHYSTEGQAVIGYCLSFPDEERIPGILRWVAVNINALLREYALNHHGCSPTIDYQQEFRAEYRVMSLNGEPVYSLLQVNFQFTEN